MSYTEFCCRAGGSNLNAGTRTGDSTEPGASPDLEYASGTWVNATRTFTVASGDPLADGVAVGDYVSVYADGATTTGYVAQVTDRTSTTITTSATVMAGTVPADGTGDRTLRVGGAWRGPNGADVWPFNSTVLVGLRSTNAGVRVNLKNDQTYSITASLQPRYNKPGSMCGYSSFYGDGGVAIIDGGTSGASYRLLDCAANSPSIYEYLELRNNGETGGIEGVYFSSTAAVVRKVIVHDVRGSGFYNVVNDVVFVECEAYNCNQSNTTLRAGFRSDVGARYIRCVSHHNSGSNSAGFYSGNNSERSVFVNCIADSNGSHGVVTGSRDNTLVFLNCDFYNNGGSGLRISFNQVATVLVENCNFIKNTQYGIDASSASSQRSGYLINCGFGSGTEANGSGNLNAMSCIEELDSITYAADVTPWVDPANGDFRISLDTATAAGVGDFTQTQSGYDGTIGYPDIGAAQRLVTGAGGGGGGYYNPFRNPVFGG